MDKILTLDSAYLSVDFENKFLKIDWNGNVELEDYKTILLKAVEISSVHKIGNIIINRLSLDSLSTECRIWMKGHFLKRIVKPLIPKLSKVATVESKSSIGQIYTNTISKTVGLVYPNLQFKSFKNEYDALQWINKESQSIVVEEERVDDPELAELTKDSGSFLDRFYKLMFK